MKRSDLFNTTTIETIEKPEKLTDGRYLIVCELAPGNDPQQWADACHVLANANPLAFEALTREIISRSDELC